VAKCSKLRLGRCAKDKTGKRIKAMKKLLTTDPDREGILVIQQQKSSQIN
jgi:hypothetical protein